MQSPAHEIPDVDDFVSDPITHHYDDMVAPFGLTNFLGTVAVGPDLVGLGPVTFPPVAQGRATTAALSIDGRLFKSFGVPVTHRWRPDRVVRTAKVDGLEIETVTACVVGEPAVVVDIRMHNTLDTARQVRMGLSLAARATTPEDIWREGQQWYSAANLATRDDKAVGSGATLPRIAFADAERTAWSLQGLDVPGWTTVNGVSAADARYNLGSGGAERGGKVEAVVELPARGDARLGYVQVVSQDRAAAEACYQRVVVRIPEALSDAETSWNTVFEDAFTPDNAQWSGHMPILKTDNAPLRRLYWWGILGVIYFRREYPGAFRPRSYDGLMPNYWATVTHPWDYSLSGVVHALLDPAEMRSQLLHWMTVDIHSCFATSGITGEPIGDWYSVNDFAMIRAINDYVRFTGDQAFLGEQVGGRAVIDHVVEYAGHWKQLRTRGKLADYGEFQNLLECVSSYAHEVASLNAANVWCMRICADLLELVDRDADAIAIRKEADELLPQVLELYEDGEGFFVARQPDGSRVPVRHIYDFDTVGTCIAADLSDAMRAEMVAYFQHDLQTENWAHALSPWDDDASFSVRADHAWNGSYPSWPSEAVRALVALGAPEVAVAWLPGLNRSTNQGPFGHAQFVEEAVPGINGGARKSPPQLPYFCDWVNASEGSWAGMVIQAILGAEVLADGSIRHEGCVELVDPTASLTNLTAGGLEYRVDSHGVRVCEPVRCIPSTCFAVPGSGRVGRDPGVLQPQMHPKAAHHFRSSMPSALQGEVK